MQSIIPPGQAISILLVDDESGQRDLIQTILDSSLIKITPASSLNEARKIIRGSTAPWNCWIIDLNLGRNQSGLSLLEESNSFPFIIVMSGLGSMQISCEATKKGALEVFDKKPQNLLTEFVDKAYRVASLGYLLNGKRTDYLATFLCLKDSVLHTAPEWADKACISIRYLEKLCNLHVGLAPRYALPYFYALCCSLYTETTFGAKKFAQPWMARFEPQHHEFLQSCIDFVQEHFETAYRPFLESRGV